MSKKKSSKNQGQMTKRGHMMDQMMMDTDCQEGRGTSGKKRKGTKGKKRA